MSQNLPKLILFFFLFLFSAAGLYAQNQKFLNHTPKYFMYLERERIGNMIMEAEDSVKAEKVFIDRLIVKNDSLYGTGNVGDSLYQSAQEQLTIFNLRTVEELANLAALKNGLVSKSTFKKQYKNFQKKSSHIDKLSGSIHGDYISQYEKLELKLVPALAGEKKILKTILANAASQLAGEGAAITKMDVKKDEKLNSGDVASVIAENLDSRLKAYNKYNDSLAAEIKILENKIDAPKEFVRDFVIIKAKVFVIDSIVNKGAANREIQYQMVDDGLSKAKRTLFNMAAFFGPGGYEIPVSKYQIAEQYFLPVIDSLVKFSNNYTSVLRTASVVVNGYSDATVIQPTSKLYPIVVEYLKKDVPAKEELNIGLSALRAESISKLLNDLLKKNYPRLTNIENIVFETIEGGMGEAFPDPSITNYRNNDDRRRVVVIYWGVLPI